MCPMKNALLICVMIVIGVASFMTEDVIKCQLLGIVAVCVVELLFKLVNKKNPVEEPIEHKNIGVIIDVFFYKPMNRQVVMEVNDSVWEECYDKNGPGYSKENERLSICIHAMTKTHVYLVVSKDFVGRFLSRERVRVATNTLDNYMETLNKG